MASFNKVILMGNLTKDPVLRQLASGKAVCDLGLAVNDRDSATFVDVTLWERQAEVAAEYLKKGSPCLIEGRLRQEKWEASDGSQRSKLSVTGERLSLVGSKANSSQSDSREPVPAGAGAEEVPF